MLESLGEAGNGNGKPSSEEKLTDIAREKLLASARRDCRQLHLFLWFGLKGVNNKAE